MEYLKNEAIEKNILQKLYDLKEVTNNDKIMQLHIA